MQHVTKNMNFAVWKGWVHAPALLSCVTLSLY